MAKFLTKTVAEEKTIKYGGVEMQQYQPSKEEVKQAESMMTEEQKQQSVERLAELKTKATEWLPKAESALEQERKRQAYLSEVRNMFPRAPVVDLGDPKLVKELEEEIEFAKKILAGD